MLNIPSTEKNDRQAVEENRSHATSVRSRDISCARRRYRTFWLESRSLGVSHEQEQEPNKAAIEMSVHDEQAARYISRLRLCWCERRGDCDIVCKILS